MPAPSLACAPFDPVDEALHNSEGTFRTVRMQDLEGSDAVTAAVVWQPRKSLWITSMTLGALVGGPLLFTWGALVLFLVTTAITVCLGHPLGMHRRLIHRAFDCPMWLERLFVYLGTLVGMAGPFGMIRQHDMRDWAQRKPTYHPYLAHRAALIRDAYWQLHCELKRAHPPELRLERRVSADPFYRFLERTWMAQQLPWAVFFSRLVVGLGWCGELPCESRRPSQVTGSLATSRTIGAGAPGMCMARARRVTTSPIVGSSAWVRPGTTIIMPSRLRSAWPETGRDRSGLVGSDGTGQRRAGVGDKDARAAAQPSKSCASRQVSAPMSPPFTFSGRMRPLAYLLASLGVFLSQHVTAIVVFEPSRQRLPARAADWHFYVMPLQTLAKHSNAPGPRLILALAALLLASWALSALAFRRAADADVSGWIAAFAIAPVVQIPTIVLLSVLPSRRRGDDRTPAKPGAQLDWATASQGLVIGVAVTLFAVAVSTLLFGAYGFGIFVASPFTIGATTGYFANRKTDVGSWPTAKLTSGALLLGGLGLVIVALEGLICILMAAPLAITSALVGALMGRAIAVATRRPPQQALSGFALLPLIFALESSLPTVV